MSHRWDRTPPLEVEIDRHHWQSQGLIGLWSMRAGAGSTLHDASSWQRHGTLTAMDPATDWVVDDNCLALDYDGSDDRVSLGNVADVWQTPSGTVIARIKYDLTAQRAIGGSWGGGKHIYAYTLAVSGRMVLYMQGSGTSVLTDTTNLSANTWTTVAITYDQATTTATFFVNGVQSSSASFAAAASADYQNANTVSWGTIGNGSLIPALGRASFYRYYDYALTPRQIAEISRAPNLIWRPQHSYWFGETPAVSGAITATLPALQSSGSGTPVSTATATATLPALQSALTGQTDSSGTVTVSLPALRAAASGTPVSTSSGAAALPRLRAVMSGAPIVTATSSAALPSLAAALSNVAQTRRHALAITQRRRYSLTATLAQDNAG